MFLFVVVLTGCLVSGSLADFCLSGYRDRCHSKFPFKNLERRPTAREAMDACPEVLAFFDCMMAGAILCSEKEGSDNVLQYLKMQALLREACDPDSDLHHSLLRNMDCISEKVITNHKAVDECVKRAGPRIAELMHENSADCGPEAAGIVCSLIHTETNCGEEARKLVLTGARRMDLMVNIPDCSNEQLENIIGAMTPTEEVGNPIENALNTLLRRK